MPEAKSLLGVCKKFANFVNFETKLLKELAHNEQIGLSFLLEGICSIGQFGYGTVQG